VSSVWVLLATRKSEFSIITQVHGVFAHNVEALDAQRRLVAQEPWALTSIQKHEVAGK